jgi:hypothetical protein
MFSVQSHLGELTRFFQSVLILKSAHKVKDKIEEVKGRLVVALQLPY